MAEFSMWGPESGGARLAQKDQQATQINNLAMQQSIAQTQDIQAQTQERQVKAKADRQAMEFKQIQQQAMQKVAMDTQGKTMQERGTAALNAGLWEEGSKMLVNASQIVQHQATAEHAQAQASLEKDKSQIAMLEAFGQGISKIPLWNQAAYDSFVKQIEGVMGRKLPKEISGATWTPELQQLLQAEVTKQKDQVDGIRKDKDSASQAALRESHIRLNKIKETKETATAELERARITKLTREGGDTKVTKVRGEDRVNARNLIMNRIPGLDKDDAGLNSEAAYVADQAYILTSKNRALDYSTALQQALNTAIANGDITKEAKKGWFGGESSKSKFSPGTKGNIPPLKPSEPSNVKPSSLPKHGEVVRGFRYTGKDDGDRGDKANWEKV